MAKERIEHEGKVVSVDKDYIAVEILNKSACAACHAKGVCGASDASVKVVEVAQDITTLVQDYQVGETVNVVMSATMGTEAVWLAYAIPLLLLLAVLLGLYTLGVKELYAGLAGIGAALLYYLILRLFKEKLSNEYSFYIKEKS